MSEQDVYQGLEPREVWRHFAAFNRIPRRSKQEAAVMEYVRQVAEANGAEFRSDAAGNGVIRIPATPGCEQAPPVVIQAHVDMVCEKRPEVEHDFDRDPIRPRIEGDRVYATGTTLGADNGIGAAMGLATLTTPGLTHGPLELLFTVDEETGLTGAMELDPNLISARMLINLDTEDPGEVIIGCAGGAGATLHVPAPREAAPEGWVGREIVIAGLAGGHSGLEINKPLANAIKLLSQTLDAIREAGVDFRLYCLSGGNAHNAIPRDAVALIALPEAATDLADNAVSDTYTALLEHWREHEPGLVIESRPAAEPADVVSVEAEAAVLRLLRELPHGVLKMSEISPGIVQTSSNLATVDTSADEIVVTSSSRSFAQAEVDRVQAEIRSLGEEVGARVELRDGYPGWEPDPNSQLLKRTEAVYQQVCGHPADVCVVHAGLECGIIISKLPGMEAVSFGPLIRGAHTPEEYVSIPTVASSWKLLTTLLHSLAQDAS